MRALKNFILYNNTIPLVLGAIFLSAGVTFAASEDAREAIVSSETAITSIDNTFIRNVDLDTYGVEVFVNSISEDNDSYFVSYTVATVGLLDGVWQPVNEERELVVSKAALGDNDLGIRVSKELSDIHAYELRQLRETQEIEKVAGNSNKVITTKYDGLVGRMLDPRSQEFPGYNPVVTPPPAIPGPKPKRFEETLVSGQQVVIDNQVEETPTSTENIDPDPEPVVSPERPTTTTPIPPVSTTPTSTLASPVTTASSSNTNNSVSTTPSNQASTANQAGSSETVEPEPAPPQTPSADSQTPQENPQPTQNTAPAPSTVSSASST